MFFRFPKLQKFLVFSHFDQQKVISGNLKMLFPFFVLHRRKDLAKFSSMFLLRRFPFASCLSKQTREMLQCRHRHNYIKSLYCPPPQRDSASLPDSVSSNSMTTREGNFVDEDTCIKIITRLQDLAVLTHTKFRFVFCGVYLLFKHNGYLRNRLLSLSSYSSLSFPFVLLLIV